MLCATSNSVPFLRSLHKWAPAEINSDHGIHAQASAQNTKMLVRMYALAPSVWSVCLLPRLGRI